MAVLRHTPCRCQVAYRPGSRGHLTISIGERELPVRRCPYCRFDAVRANLTWYAVEYATGKVRRFKTRRELMRFLKG